MVLTKCLSWRLGTSLDETQRHRDADTQGRVVRDLQYVRSVLGADRFPSTKGHHLTYILCACGFM